MTEKLVLEEGHEARWFAAHRELIFSGVDGGGDEVVESGISETNSIKILFKFIMLQNTG